MIIDGQKISDQILEKLKKEIANHRLKPGLALILVGHDPASETYIAKKEKACAHIGMHSVVKRFPEAISEQHILDEIERLNYEENIDGILLQLPLPRHLNQVKLTSHILCTKDVDGLHPSNLGKLVTEDFSAFIPATPKGILTLLKEYKITTEGKEVVILGRSLIVGKPLSLLLSQRSSQGNATVTLLHSYSQDIVYYTRHADIVIAAVGIPHFLKEEMIKPGVVVIDVGIHKESESTIGDVDFERVKNIASYITPVPGGVGPMTIASLMENTLQSFLKNRSHKKL